MERILRLLVAQYPNWRYQPSTLGGHESNVFGIVLTALLRPALFVWDDLPGDLRAQIRAIGVAQGDAIVEMFRERRGLTNEFIGNSGGEESYWPGAPLHLLITLFRSDERVQAWQDALRFYAYHAATDSWALDEHGVHTQTVWDAFPETIARANAAVPEHASTPTHNDAYLFDNHGYHPHPGYARSVTFPATHRLTMLSFGAPAPQLGTHVHENVARRALEFVDLRTFRFRGDRIFRIRRESEVDGSPFDPRAEHVFRATGLDDWGNDALSLAFLQTLRASYGVVDWTDPVNGRRTPDLVDHALSFAHYLDAAALPRPTPAGITASVCDDFLRFDAAGAPRMGYSSGPTGRSRSPRRAARATCACAPSMADGARRPELWSSAISRSREARVRCDPSREGTPPSTARPPRDPPR